MARAGMGSASNDLQRDFGFAFLFITHDLSLLFEFAHRIAIMYAGEIVESAYPEGDLSVATFRDPAGNFVGVWQRGPA